MTTVTVTATFPGESPLTTTSVIENNTFTAGDLPIGSDVQLGVVLRQCCTPTLDSRGVPVDFRPRPDICP